MKKAEATFKSEGKNCAAHLYMPENLTKAAPAIVMAHGFSLVKEVFLERFAQIFCENGFVVLVFDYRNFGESEGDHPQHLEPYEQIKDYRNAITWLSALPEVNEEQIGIWGTSYSGGHVLHIAAVDRRVKAVVAQVPTINGRKGAARKMGSEQLASFVAKLESDRIQRYFTDEQQMLPVVSLTEPCAQPHPDAYDWFMKASKMAPTWKNEITLQSMEHYLEYNPASLMEFISPTPLLMIAAMEDGITPPDLIMEAYEEWANEPKALVQLPYGILSIKQFFPKGMVYNGQPNATSDWIKDRIQRLISLENAANPLSDQQLVCLLKEEEIEISRRTVAKYRESLLIPNSNKRAYSK